VKIRDYVTWKDRGPIGFDFDFVYFVVQIEVLHRDDRSTVNYNTRTCGSKHAH